MSVIKSVFYSWDARRRILRLRSRPIFRMWRRILREPLWILAREQRRELGMGWFVSVSSSILSLFSCVGVSREPPATPVIETPVTSVSLREIRRLRQQTPSAEVLRDQNVKDYLKRDHRYLEEHKLLVKYQNFALKTASLLLCPPIYKQIAIKIGPIYYIIAFLLCFFI